MKEGQYFFERLLDYRKHAFFFNACPNEDIIHFSCRISFVANVSSRLKDGELTMELKK